MISHEEMGQTTPVAWGNDFGAALSALKSGRRVCRIGWNGKGMWLSLTPGMMVPAWKFWSPQNQAWANRQPTKEATVLPYITMKTADDKIVPWLASQTDVLAEDWEVLPDLTENI